MYEQIRDIELINHGKDVLAKSDEQIGGVPVSTYQ